MRGQSFHLRQYNYDIRPSSIDRTATLELFRSAPSLPHCHRLHRRAISRRHRPHPITATAAAGAVIGGGGDWGGGGSRLNFSDCQSGTVTEFYGVSRRALETDDGTGPTFTGCRQFSDSRSPWISPWLVEFRRVGSCSLSCSVMLLVVHRRVIPRVTQCSLPMRPHVSRHVSLCKVR